MRISAGFSQINKALFLNIWKNWELIKTICLKLFRFLYDLSIKVGVFRSNFYFAKAFTLGEIMITLVVIGVITSILLPVAFYNILNGNVMKLIGDK